MNREDIHFRRGTRRCARTSTRSAQLMGEVLREQGGEELLAAGRAGPADRDPLARGRRRRRRGACGARARAAAARWRASWCAAFSAWFQLVNVAEKVHRIRRRREYFQQDGERPQPGGVEDALAELKAAGLSLEEVLELLAQLSIEPVLLAHPMESTRRTTLRRQQRMAGLLLEREQRDCWRRTSAARCWSASAPRSAPTGRPRSIRASA